MNFQQIDIKRFLIDAIPSRFNNLTPSEFESFMAFLFKTDGYEVEKLTKKGDHAANLIAKKDEVTLCIRVLRYEPDVFVKVHDIQQAAAARTYYDTDQSWIISTSNIPDDVRKEAEAQDIELWDWDVFYSALSQLFFDGKSHFEFMEALEPRNTIENPDPEVRLKAKWQPEEGITSEWYNLDLVISNPSDRNIYIHLDLPAFIDAKKNQMTAEKWADNEFVAGIIYAGASVRTNALFKASRMGERPPGGRVMLTCHERTDPPSTYHLSAKLKGSACYVVTYCYGRQSPEYKLMTTFRDETLDKSYFGQLIISGYYYLSPGLIRLVSKHRMLELSIRIVTKHFIAMVQKCMTKK